MALQWISQIQRGERDFLHWIRKSSGGKEISVVWFDFSGWEKPFPIADEPMRDARRKPPAD